MFTYTILGLVSLAIMYYMATTSPVGYEDEHGFYYGYPPVV